MNSDTHIQHLPPSPRRVFANRTLNLRSIRAIGFDMDYTLIHYRIEEWERRAYEHARQKLLNTQRWPVEQLNFDPMMASRGLVIDKELGNIVKADRFGYVKRASHGTRMLSFEDQRSAYSQELVDLRENRWAFLNTLFALSEACLFAQCVDLLDEGKLGEAIGYADLHRATRESVDEAHMMGHLKGEVAADPDFFVDIDTDLAQTLFDLRQAGKRLLLITNSEWSYTRKMMSYAFDPWLPHGLRSWRELFDIVIVGSRKPRFFSDQNPCFEVIDEEGLLRPCIGNLKKGSVYLGCDASTVEAYLGLKGAEILYVGDHIFTDVNISKRILHWRTALIMRELEAEIENQETFGDKQTRIDELMAEKQSHERHHAHLRLEHQRREQLGQDVSKIRRQLAEQRDRMMVLDEAIGPLVKSAAELGNPRWGPIMRTGIDKSHLARQVERYADVYTSRVSNFGLVTPFAYIRSPRSSLPHDCGPDGYGE